MRNAIVGTAGHVDHGKTCLIKALTGIDTDRLKEEKKRGITIELGFANLPNDRDLHIGIIDVPGHEKFVKNMLAGIGGIDLVLLVVAADEGIMPQTREHFEIMKMLGIRDGIIVYTKADLADPDMMELIDEDVTEMVEGSFLENAERISVAAYTGENVDRLKEMILDKLKHTTARKEEPELMRLPIDRVFTMEGHGTVITGTLTEGSLELGEEVQVYPTEQIVKIRQIQSHGDNETHAVAGQRTALNLTGVRKENIQRGEVLAYPGSMICTSMIDVRLSLFESAERALKNGDRVHFNYGSAQTECKAALLDRDVLNAGESCFAQLRFEKPIALKRGDRFIVRFFSPLVTIGGGYVLDASARKHKRNNAYALEYLSLLDKGDDKEAIHAVIRAERNVLPNAGELAVKLGLTESDVRRHMETLSQENLVRINESLCITKELWEQVINTSNEILKAFHKENPILKGMQKEEFLGRLRTEFRFESEKKTEILFDAMVEKHRVKVDGSAVSSSGFDASISDEFLIMLDSIESVYQEAGIEVPSTQDVVARYEDTRMARQMINELSHQGKLKKMDNTAYIHADSLKQALTTMYAYYDEHPTMTLADFRTMMNTSRKYALMILEYCDAKRITRKDGDVRVLLKRVFPQ